MLYARERLYGKGGWHHASDERPAPRLHGEHPSNLVALMMAGILEDTIQRGFTTVRDAGGTDWSFKAAVERGIVEGPRLLVSDRPLSQTGAHGDWRRGTET